MEDKALFDAMLAVLRACESVTTAMDEQLMVLEFAWQVKSQAALDHALYTRIAKLLNAEQAPAPRPQQSRPAGWAPSSVNEILHRDLYRGVVTWNRTRNRNQWGQHRQAARPRAEWERRDMPALRIVSEDA